MATNYSYSATKVLTDVFIDITQDISQGLAALQILNVDCNSNGAGQNCLACIQAWKKLSNDPKIPEKACNSVCVCKVENINMDQNIVINLQSWLDYTNKEDFIKKINNSINQNAQSSGQSLYPNGGKGDSSGDRVTNIANISNKIYDSMKSTTFQEAIQSIKTLQIINLEGGGSIVNVNLNDFTQYFGQILENNGNTSSLINELDASMIQLSTSVTDAGLARLILWIVRIIVAVIILIVLFYSIGLIFQVYTLYIVH